MFLLDVPMYLEKAQLSREESWNAFVQLPKQTTVNGVIFALHAGLVDSMRCVSVTQSLADWRGEMLWLSGYFTLAVWLSQHLLTPEMQALAVRNEKDI